MSDSAKDSACVKLAEIMKDRQHPYHSKLATEVREAAIREVLRLNEILTEGENVESN
jgi:hypothetical protein